MTDLASEKRFREDLPKALVLLRESRGLSQQELARRLGVHPSVLSRYETGVRTPATVKLSELLKTLVSSWSELEVALAEVRRARSEGGEPSVDALLDDEEAGEDDLLVELLAANRQGRGREFVHRLTERARYAAYLQARLRTHLALREADEAETEQEPTSHRNGDDGKDDG